VVVEGVPHSQKSGGLERGDCPVSKCSARVAGSLKAALEDQFGAGFAAFAEIGMIRNAHDGSWWARKSAVSAKTHLRAIAFSQRGFSGSKLSSFSAASLVVMTKEPAIRFPLDLVLPAEIQALVGHSICHRPVFRHLLCLLAGWFIDWKGVHGMDVGED
jgi:hypothetical protein